MSAARLLFQRPGQPFVSAFLNHYTDSFGYQELDLVRPPARLWPDVEAAPPCVDPHADARRVTAVPTPAELLAAGPPDTWMAMTRRSLARMRAWFLIAEDPQRRLQTKPIETLAHQASVVQHIAQQPTLRRVLLADEVGLGKTVEAGLLIQRVLAQNPSARVLYLAPARLVRNVRRELDRLDLGFGSWVAGEERDTSLKSSRVIASIHRASHKGKMSEVLDAPPWDMIVVDECHHLSDWAPGGGSPGAQYKLVQRLAERLGEDGRLLLMSGTPHQGSKTRFRNLLRLLQARGEDESVLAGRVIYRTKEDVRDWSGQPLFPGRQVNPEQVVDLGPTHRDWLARIHELFAPQPGRSAQGRAAGWRAGQALQWATSSVQAGLGYLVRLAIRAGCRPSSLPGLVGALEAIRPYRLGPADEPVERLFERIKKEVARQLDEDDVEDIEDMDEDAWRPDLGRLSKLLDHGVMLLGAAADAKWEFLFERVLRPAGDEKVVLFAQPIETVTAVATYLERKTGQRPALIIGDQSEAERSAEIARFWDERGARFLVSSRAGGEGLNLQVARRLVHLDVPWNPMDLEQRIGRVHRFQSRRTIVVDTLVVKDSREVDTYACAREKLKTIASVMVPDDRFDALFGRVMSLVPPDELQDILGRGPVGPLSPEDEARVAALVTRGFEEWQQFHRDYAEQRSQIRALDPGEASWRDLVDFAKEHLGAEPAAGFSALGFQWQAGEVVEASREADVLTIAGRPYACGDHGGMPVTRGDDGTRAERLGTNSDIVVKKLWEIACPGVPAGAAHVRWPDDAPRPCEGIFGVLVFARQSVRLEQGSYVEHAAQLYCTVVTAGGQARPVEGHDKGELLRALGRGKLRRDPAEAMELVAAMQRVEAEIALELRRPTDADREARVSHAVTPLVAAIVS